MYLRTFLRLFAHIQMLPILESGEETLVGGQAVMEGVMMRAPHSYCVAVRKPSGEITTEVPVTSMPATEKPFAVTPAPTGPTPIWAQIPMKYILPAIIAVIVLAIAGTGYYLYRRRQKSEQFFER